MPIKIPHNFIARTYQIPVMNYFHDGGKRAVCVWHRRSGKDTTALNIIIKEAIQKVGIYYYLFPTYNQGKKILWDGINKEGKRFIDYFPAEIIKSKNETEMKIVLINGSIFQIVGTDNFNSIMGTNPIGCVFSEFSLQDPRAWDMIRPILTENGGWALFDYTPRGKNHGWDIYKMAKDNPDWFCQLLTVDDTKVITKEQIETERREGMDEDLIQQEFYCSFEGSVLGSYYATLLREARNEKRIGVVPYDKDLPVHTFWDLGIGDAMSIWFAQFFRNEIRLIDYYEAQGEGLSYYVGVLKGKGYAYGNHYFPHDIQVKELGTGKSRFEILEGLGVNPSIVPKMSVDDGINAVRSILNRCWFDEMKTQRGYDALNSYHKEYDEDRKCFKNKPYHDWSSHGADAFRYLSLSYKQIYSPAQKSQTEFDKKSRFSNEFNNTNFNETQRSRFHYEQ
jgi:phage terminase large subunit